MYVYFEVLFGSRIVNYDIRLIVYLNYSVKALYKF